MRFYFTFGFSHVNGDGTPLRDRYCVVEAEDEFKARRKMFDVRGQRWSNAYESADAAGVEEFGLTEIALNELTPESVAA